MTTSNNQPGAAAKLPQQCKCRQQGCLWPMAFASWRFAVEPVHGIMLQWQQHLQQHLTAVADQRAATLQIFV